MARRVIECPLLWPSLKLLRKDKAKVYLGPSSPQKRGIPSRKWHFRDSEVQKDHLPLFSESNLSPLIKNRTLFQLLLTPSKKILFPTWMLWILRHQFSFHLQSHHKKKRKTTKNKLNLRKRNNQSLAPSEVVFSAIPLNLQNRRLPLLLPLKQGYQLNQNSHQQDQTCLSFLLRMLIRERDSSLIQRLKKALKREEQWRLALKVTKKTPKKLLPSWGRLVRLTRSQ